MYPESPSFGTMIRATRLGWGYAKRHGCFIRMSDAEGVNSRIELCPIHAVPKGRVEGGNHRVWWEHGDDVLRMIPWLQPVRAIKRYVSVVVDEHGTILRTGQ